MPWKSWRLDFDSPVRALALGQGCAFYSPEQQLLGGGFFEKCGGDPM